MSQLSLTREEAMELINLRSQIALLKSQITQVEKLQRAPIRTEHWQKGIKKPLRTNPVLNLTQVSLLLGVSRQRAGKLLQTGELKNAHVITVKEYLLSRIWGVRNKTQLAQRDAWYADRLERIRTAKLRNQKSRH